MNTTLKMTAVGGLALALGLALGLSRPWEHLGRPAGGPEKPPPNGKAAQAGRQPGDPSALMVEQLRGTQRKLSEERLNNARRQLESDLGELNGEPARKAEKTREALDRFMRRVRSELQAVEIGP